MPDVARRYVLRVLHHLTLWVPDIERAAPSWRWLLGELGYALDRDDDRLLLFRHPGGFALVLEESPDMVPGMLFSRLRPGLNHVAFTVPEGVGLQRLLVDAAGHGWTTLPTDGHAVAGGREVAYLEDRDGFEVELVS